MLKSLVSALALSVFVSACASSTVGPGAGTAESIVQGSVDEVNQRAENVFKDMKIQKTGDASKNNGTERQLMGKMGSTDVKVTIDNASSKTVDVKVEASKNAAQGNRDLAKKILSQIVSEG
ncbi:MAG TPA: hypothetical protein VL588_13020 [Bdellovibrionota bacterium]|jgi:hypothetical protein|nr:hypothetical protein [Bdellovibrionota bacterium]